MQNRVQNTKRQQWFLLWAFVQACDEMAKKWVMVDKCQQGRTYICRRYLAELTGLLKEHMGTLILQTVNSPWWFEQHNDTMFVHCHYTELKISFEVKVYGSFKYSNIIMGRHTIQFKDGCWEIASCQMPNIYLKVHQFILLLDKVRFLF